MDEKEGARDKVTHMRRRKKELEREGGPRVLS